eukprot:3297160-Pyramimonas_sp.AAC.1
MKPCVDSSRVKDEPKPFSPALPRTKRAHRGAALGADSDEAGGVQVQDELRTAPPIRHKIAIIVKLDPLVRRR